jgi:hypothetical protein
MNANNSNQRSRGRGPSNRNSQRSSGGRNNGGKHSTGNNGSNRGGGRGGNNQPRNPNQIKQQLDKYLSQAREMTQSGDRVGAEAMFQYAEHYQRLFNDLSAAKSQENKANREHNHKPNADAKSAKPVNGGADAAEKPNQEAKVAEKTVEASVDVEKAEAKPEAGAVEQAQAKPKPKPKAKPRPRRNTPPTKTVAAE